MNNVKLIVPCVLARKTRQVRGHGYAYKLRDEYCTGSLISRQVVITAGHCIERAAGSTLMVNFLDQNKLLFFRSVKKFYVFRQPGGADVGLLLLTKPVSVCNQSESLDERLGIIRLPLGNPRTRWTDKDISRSKCMLYGYGRNEKHVKIDFRLRSMVINLEPKPPLLAANLSDSDKKVCAGDSGGPVICERNGFPYLIGISTSVTSFRTSKTPQLCKLKTADGQYAVISGAKFYDVRRGIPRILRFLNVHGQINNLIIDMRKCFGRIH